MNKLKINSRKWTHISSHNNKDLTELPNKSTLKIKSITFNIEKIMQFMKILFFHDTKVKHNFQYNIQKRWNNQNENTPQSPKIIYTIFSYIQCRSTYTEREIWWAYIEVTDINKSLKTKAVSCWTATQPVPSWFFNIYFLHEFYF